MSAALFLFSISATVAVPGRASPQSPVRVWLGAAGPIAPGSPVRVYVQTVADGYVVVLHRRPDGVVEVLFPGDPASDPFTAAGTYEIRGPRGAAALTAQGHGSGVVLAALSPDPFRFAEFVRGAVWDGDALRASWAGADALGSLTDIVQRMLGDGSFNYDLVTYTVAAPATYAIEDTTPGAALPAACVGCSYAQFNVVIVDQPLFLFPRGHEGEQERDPLRAATPPATALALYHSGRTATPVAARRERAAPPVTPVGVRRRVAAEPPAAAPTVPRMLPPLVIEQPRARSSISTDVRLSSLRPPRPPLPPVLLAGRRQPVAASPAPVVVALPRARALAWTSGVAPHRAAPVPAPSGAVGWRH